MSKLLFFAAILTICNIGYFATAQSKCNCGDLAKCFYDEISDIIPTNEINKFVQECKGENETKTFRQKIYACFEDFNFEEAIKKGKDCQTCMLKNSEVCTMNEGEKLELFDWANPELEKADATKIDWEKDGENFVKMQDSFQCLGGKMEEYCKAKEADPAFVEKMKNMEKTFGAIPGKCQAKLECEKPMKLPMEAMDCDMVKATLQCFAPHYFCILESIGIDSAAAMNHMAAFKKDMNCENMKKMGPKKLAGDEVTTPAAGARRRRSPVFKYGYHPLAVVMAMMV